MRQRASGCVGAEPDFSFLGHATSGVTAKNLWPAGMLRPDTFGRPGEGVHFRVLGVAVVDLALTLLAARWLARAAGWDFWPTAAGLVALGEAAHAAVGVRTQGVVQLERLAAWLGISA